MSKLNQLTQNEFDTYEPSSSILTAIEEERQRLGVAKSDFKILDFGCGRGRAVLYLRNLGYDAYGLDGFATPIENGRALFKERGLDGETYLRQSDETGQSSYEADFFDFCVSDQVFEHVKNLDQAAREISRVTKKGARGLHIYPSKWVVAEGHLYMPFVHWMPKHSQARKKLIAHFYRKGVHPDWDHPDIKAGKDPIEVYNDYLNDRTYYRSVAQVVSTFRKHQLFARANTLMADKVRQHPKLSKIAKVPLLGGLLNWGLITFRSVHLHYHKP